MEGLGVLLAQWSSLAGFGALIGFLINILKTAGVIKDGQAVAWSTGLNLLGLIGLFVIGLAAPAVDLSAIDSQVAQFVQVGLVVFAYVLQLLGAKVGHIAVRGTPFIGKSYSE